MPVVDQDQKFLIVHVSRQIIENGVPVLDNTALVGIGKEMIVNGHTYKPIAAITRSEGGGFSSGHFKFQCRRGEFEENWFEVDDNKIPTRICEPKRGFLYLFMMDQPKHDSSASEDSIMDH